MSRLKHILIVLMTFSIFMAGLPVQAKPACPMAAMMMDLGHDSPDCHKTTKHEKQQNGGCCKDMACNIQCSAISGLSIVPAFKYVSSDVVRIVELFIPASSMPPSHILYTQERPPQILS